MPATKSLDPGQQHTWLLSPGRNQRLCPGTGSHVCVPAPVPLCLQHSIGVLYFLLARMVLEMRGVVSAAQPWGVMVDLFFYR